MQPDVTVVIPTHNRRDLVPATIASVLNQRGVRVHVVIVDDGSTDGSGVWLDRVAAREPRIEVVHHQRPRRLPAARNAGTARARGRWIAFCDDDDLWAPDKLNAQIDALAAGSARWACTGTVSVDRDLKIIGHHQIQGGEVLRALLARNEIPSGSSVMAELDFIKEAGGFDETLTASEDWEMWIRLAQRSTLAVVDRPLLAYRQAAGTMSTDTGRMRSSRAIVLERYAALAAQYGVQPNDVAFERFLAKQMLRAGAGRKAASIYAGLVREHRRWQDVPRMVAALLAPRLTDRVGTARASAAVPRAWRIEADAWLEPFRRRLERRQRRQQGLGPVEARTAS
jgi:glycosyltransferase involved in cell wall biosynthesis